MYVDVKQPATAQNRLPELNPNWRAVLYHGDVDKHLPLGVASYEQDLEETLA